MQQPCPSRPRTAWKTRAASALLVVLALDLVFIATSASVLPPLHRSSLDASSQFLERRSFALEKRVPSPPNSAVPTASATTALTTPPITPTTDAPLPTTTTTIITTTTTQDPPTSTVAHTATTSTTADTVPSTTTSSAEIEPTESTTRHTGSSQTSTGRPAGPSGSVNPSSISTTNSTIPPTATPTNSDKSSGPPVLPIVLGSVFGLGAVIGAGVFFFFRFRKHRRFDSKRPLSFLALSLDDSTGGAGSASTRATGADAIYDANRPITSQPSLRYTPPAIAGGMGGNGRYSYQTSEKSDATAAQYAQWSQDDENAALVGGPTRQQQLMMAEHGDDGYPGAADLLSDDNGFKRPRPESEESFVASSMFPLARNDPRHARRGRESLHEQQEMETVEARHVGNPQQISPTIVHEDVPLQVMNVREESGPLSQRPLSVHSNTGLSVRNPSPTPGHDSTRPANAEEDDLQYL